MKRELQITFYGVRASKILALNHLPAYVNRRVKICTPETDEKLDWDRLKHQICAKSCLSGITLYG